MVLPVGANALHRHGTLGVVHTKRSPGVGEGAAVPLPLLEEELRELRDVRSPASALADTAAEPPAGGHRGERLPRLNRGKGGRWGGGALLFLTIVSCGC